MNIVKEAIEGGIGKGDEKKNGTMIYIKILKTLNWMILKELILTSGDF